jgi:phage N-6-adenine-methyltransferase
MKEIKSQTVEWYTPGLVLLNIMTIFGKFDLDPCSSAISQCGTNGFTKEQDGLSMDWYGSVFVNPPYGRDIIKWVEKCAIECKRKEVNHVIALLPSRTDTQWYHKVVLPNITHKVELEGRIRFINENGERGGSPSFASMVVRFNRYADGRPILMRMEAT